MRDTFIDSVKLRLRSDVPVGVLLSGGIDSSAIAATVHHLDPSRNDIKLLSAVGEYGSNDEQPFIDMMANHLKRPVEKVVLNYPSSKALDISAEVSWFNDEPIGSFSTVAHHLLMKKASDCGITVLLSGQGADEILCGYKKYLGFYLQELIGAGHCGRPHARVQPSSEIELLFHSLVTERQNDICPGGYVFRKLMCAGRLS